MFQQHESHNEITFADDNVANMRKKGNGRSEKKWKIMVVDDDPSIHDVTRLALNGFEFDGHGLEIFSCYSGSEANSLIEQHDDIALILLDVVMEHEHAGLETAKHIREVAQNRNVRIVLRTGQPGQAPERQVIRDYDINDYKEKTELTSQKLYTLLYASLRSFRDILTIDTNKKGLERVLGASANIFELTNMQQFAKGVLIQLTALLNLDPGAVLVHYDGLAASYHQGNLTILAGNGSFDGQESEDGRNSLPSDVLNDIDAAIKAKQSLFLDGRFVGYYKNKEGVVNLLYVSGVEDLSRIDRNLIELFNTNVSVAFENVQLHSDVEETQREIVYMLGEAVETRSKETGNHVKRVAEMSKLLAQKLGLTDHEAEMIKLASPLHDVGKIGIPDAILNKPGKLTAEEWEVMKSHAASGAKMLMSSKKRVLQAGAVIAEEHHEKWDGSGYPCGKKGKDIHLFGRITALVDVFDALSSDRCYKKAWPLEDTLALIRKERGKHFDPDLVDLMLDNLDGILAIRDQFQDQLHQQ